MDINLDSLTPEQAASLLEQLKERERQSSTDLRVGQEIDRVLSASLDERGISVGAPWQDPGGLPTRAYPKGWTSQHDGHWWRAITHAVLTEPGSGGWELNDPEPAPETSIEGQDA